MFDLWPWCVEPVFSVPRIAPSVRLTSAGATALQVEWTQLDSSEACGVITYYQIWTRMVGNAEESQVRLRANNRNSYVLTG